MALNQKRLFGPAMAPSSPTDSQAGRYEVPTGTTSTVKEIIFCNTSTSASVSVGVGTTATASNRIISSLIVSSSETVVFDCSLVLSASEKLFLVSSNGAVATTVNGIEES